MENGKQNKPKKRYYEYVVGILLLSFSVFGLSHLIKYPKTQSELKDNHLQSESETSSNMNTSKAGPIAAVKSKNESGKTHQEELASQATFVSSDENYKEIAKSKEAIREAAEVKTIPSEEVTQEPKPVQELTQLETSTIKAAEVPKNHLENEIERGYRLALTPYYTMATLSVTDSATGSKSTLASNLGTGAFLQYTQEWSENFKTFIGFKLGYISFEAPASAARTLEDKNKVTSGIALGSEIMLSKKLSLTATVRYQKELFARALSTTAITMDTVNVPSIGIKLSYDLARLNPFTIGVSSVSELKMAATTDQYSVDNGMLYGGTIYLKHDSGPHYMNNIQTELGYFTRMQNTSLVQQTENELMLSVRFFFGGSDPTDPHFKKGDH